MQGCEEPKQQDSWQPLNCLSASCAEPRAWIPSGEWKKRGALEQGWGVGRGRWAGRWGEAGRHEKTDAATVALAFQDINSARPYCANLIGNVSGVLLGLRHTLASKWNERRCEKKGEVLCGGFCGVLLSRFHSFTGWFQAEGCVMALECCRAALIRRSFTWKGLINLKSFFPRFSCWLNSCTSLNESSVVPDEALISAFFSCYTPKHVSHSEGNIPASKLQMCIFYDDVHTLVNSAFDGTSIQM